MAAAPGRASTSPPSGCSHYDVWDAVVGGLASGADPDHLVMGTERRALDSIWGGSSASPRTVTRWNHRCSRVGRDVLGIAPDASGLVDHERIGEESEREPGAVSIMTLLLEDLRAG